MSRPIGERDIFGGSDSELSSDEEDVSRQQKVSRRESPGARAAASLSAESSGDSDDFRDAEPSAAPAAKKARRPRARRLNEPELDGGERVKRKRKRREPVEEENVEDLTPEQRQRRERDAKIEAILKPSKGKRRQGKKKGDEEVLDRFADEEVSRLRETMLAAADDDETANRAQQPAMTKLRLLPQVMEVLRKTALEQSIMDNNLLGGVRRWLEPLPDRSLPALNIQQEFFRALPDMKFIDSSILKESGLGRVVLFYTKCKRVTPEIRRIANNLVSKWSRPIIKRSASYRDRVVPTADASESRAAPDRLNAILARAREEDKHRVRKNAVAIPNSQLGNYSVAPTQSQAIGRGGTTSVDLDVQRRKANADRLRSLTRKVAAK